MALTEHRIPKTVAYIRASTDKQDTDNQKLQILEFAHKRDMKLDSIIELTISSQLSEKARRITELIELLHDQDTLIVTELSRLGRNTAQVILLVNRLIEHNIRIIVIKQNLDFSKHDMHSKIMVTLFSLFSEIERDIISQRTKDALAAKRAQGIVFGKPKGTIQKSKFDAHIERIQELLKLGLSVRKTAKLLGYNNAIGLNNYLNKRKLKPQIN